MSGQRADAVIVGVALVAGHDGRAEALLDVHWPNGAVRSIAVPQEDMEAAMDAAGIGALDALVGRSWDVLLGARPATTRGT